MAVSYSVLVITCVSLVGRGAPAAVVGCVM